MINNPIYEPKGKAKEYADLALNIYTGCTHGCEYCYAPRVLRKTADEFKAVLPRKEIAESVKAQLSKGKIKNSLIHLCFACDPYPTGVDTTVTREIIKTIKESGNHVQILTKSTGVKRDLDLLDRNDWVGITLSGDDNVEPYAASESERIETIMAAKAKGIKTWISFEPVLDQLMVQSYIVGLKYIVDKVAVGKPSNYNAKATYTTWREFGRQIEELCLTQGTDYYIKDSLRAEMG